MKRNMSIAKIALCAVCVLVIAAGVKCHAETTTKTEVVTLPLNKETELLRPKSVHENGVYVGIYYYYRFDCKKPGYLSITALNGGTSTLYVSDNSQGVGIYEGPRYTLIGTCKIPLDVGTIYILVSDDVKIRAKYAKAVNEDNYCRAKAVTLKKKKKVTVCQTDDYDYDRWYKIKLTKAKELAIWQSDGMKYTVYDSKKRMVSMDKSPSNQRAFSLNKLKKGTYYIVFYAYMNSSSSQRVTTFYWK